MRDKTHEVFIRREKIFLKRENLLHHEHEKGSRVGFSGVSWQSLGKLVVPAEKAEKYC